MVFLRKLKEVMISVLPIVAIILVLNFTVIKFETSTLVKFIVAIVLICVGEVFFLTGVDSTIMPMGEMVGTSVNKVSNFFLFIFFAFLFGMFATIAEPDVQVLSKEIVGAGAIGINNVVLTFVIGAGVGLFIAFALLRIVKHVPIKIIYAIFLIITFLIASFLPTSIIAVAFDSGGSTVGIVTTPFVLALTSGIVDKSSKNSNDNFGVIGLASLGPIIAVLLLSVCLSGTGTEQTLASSNYNIFIDVLYNTMMAIIPLVAVFYIFQIIYIKLPKSKKLSMIVGVCVTFVGLYLFLFGINYGLIEIGNSMGKLLSSKNIYIVLIVYIIFAFSIVFTEPSVRVLGAQVEAETQGNINRKLVNISIAIAMALAVSLSAVRVYFDLNIWYFLGTGYALIGLLMLFTPSLFVSIAFDSGGVASGPMCTALLMPAMVAMSSSSVEGFGFIAMVGMMPVIVLELLGVIYNIQTIRAKKSRYKVALRIAYGADKYSNMEKLEARHKQLQQIKEATDNG